MHTDGCREFCEHSTKLYYIIAAALLQKQYSAEAVVW